MPWDRDITLKVLDKFEDKDFAFLATRITNAFLSGAARALFREPIEGVETLCECPKAEHVRRGHGEAVRFLENDEAFRISLCPLFLLAGVSFRRCWETNRVGALFILVSRRVRNLSFSRMDLVQIPLSRFAVELLGPLCKPLMLLMKRLVGSSL